MDGPLTGPRRRQLRRFLATVRRLHLSGSVAFTTARLAGCRTRPPVSFRTHPWATTRIGTRRCGRVREGARTRGGRHGHTCGRSRCRRCGSPGCVKHSVEETARTRIGPSGRAALHLLACCPRMPTDVVAVLLGMRHARSAAQLLLRLRTAGLAHYKNSETWAIGRIESDFDCGYSHPPDRRSSPRED